MAQIISTTNQPNRLLSDQTRESASLAASHAHVTIRPLEDQADFLACEALFNEVWRPEAGSSLMAKDLLRGIRTADSYVSGAFESGHLVGACVAFWGPPGSRRMHSHIAGVSSNARGKSVGYALKLDQRALALERQVETITWTFDPLVRRNAFFNFHKLGAVASQYLVNYYGLMLNEINGGDESDRLLSEWHLTASGVVSRCDEPTTPRIPTFERTDAAAALTVGPAGQPLAGPTSAATLLVGLPRDIETLRLRDPGLAHEWRTAVREVLAGNLTHGGLVEGFDPETNSYIVTKGANS